VKRTFTFKLSIMLGTPNVSVTRVTDLTSPAIYDFVMTGRQWKKRTEIDNSQRWRVGVQYFFLLLTFWIGLEFLFFVRGLEGQWVPWIANRPAGVEGWLPIAGLMNIRYFLLTGTMPVIHPAAMVLLLIFVVLSVLFRKAFCSWICPVGTVSEWVWKQGREAFGRSFVAPNWLDWPLRACKYALLGAFSYAILRMDADDLAGFLASPYGLMADVKMLNFFRFVSPGAAGFLGVLLIGSVFMPNFWCRYLCPYGALMGLGALWSPARIRRERDACIDCGKCARVCASHLPVDKLVQIQSVECTGCMECVAACPAEGALTMTFAGKRRSLTGQRLAVAIVVVFLAGYFGARATGHWESAISAETYRQLVPQARELDHPR
jgi:polyferredoxin